MEGRSKKKLVQINFWVKKILGPNNIWCQKILGSNNFWAEIFGGQREFWVPKCFRSKQAGLQKHHNLPNTKNDAQEPSYIISSIYFDK